MSGKTAQKNSEIIAIIGTVFRHFTAAKIDLTQPARKQKERKENFSLKI